VPRQRRRSTLVARPAAWFAAGFGCDRISAVTCGEITGWREHLAATVLGTHRDGRQITMTPAMVNNHLAHLSAFFTWTAAYVPWVPGQTGNRLRLVQLPRGGPAPGR